MIRKKTLVNVFKAPIETDLSELDLEDNINRFIDGAEDDGVNFEVIDIKYTCNATMHFAMLIYSTLDSIEED